MTKIQYITKIKWIQKCNIYYEKVIMIFNFFNAIQFKNFKFNFEYSSQSKLCACDLILHVFQNYVHIGDP